ncbi:hypothetical protein C7M84_009013 [Penaeus vannamei]|uniref:Uncharacterized protein n=1 Tax=Penaeus vannamei TaxID=6689 RepID=A0A3R7PI23_PENVA|nr:hypothetical protein C7M84_009013 [Penaeus vannamei]
MFSPALLCSLPLNIISHCAARINNRFIARELWVVKFSHLSLSPLRLPFKSSLLTFTLFYDFYSPLFPCLSSSLFLLPYLPLPHYPFFFSLRVLNRLSSTWDLRFSHSSYPQPYLKAPKETRHQSPTPHPPKPTPLPTSKPTAPSSPPKPTPPSAPHPHQNPTANPPHSTPQPPPLPTLPNPPPPHASFHPSPPRQPSADCQSQTKLLKVEPILLVAAKCDPIVFDAFGHVQASRTQSQTEEVPSSHRLLPSSPFPLFSFFPPPLPLSLSSSSFPSILLFSPPPSHLSPSHFTSPLSPSFPPPSSSSLSLPSPSSSFPNPSHPSLHPSSLSPLPFPHLSLPSSPHSPSYSLSPLLPSSHPSLYLTPIYPPILLPSHPPPPPLHPHPSLYLTPLYPPILFPSLPSPTLLPLHPLPSLTRPLPYPPLLTPLLSLPPPSLSPTPPSPPPPSHPIPLSHHGTGCIPNEALFLLGCCLTRLCRT